MKAIHGLGHDDSINMKKFMELSPTLLYMQVSNSCVESTDQNTTAKGMPTLAERKNSSESTALHASVQLVFRIQ